MRRALIAVLLAVAGGAAAPALGAPAELTLRIEGRTQTLFEGPVTTTTARVDGGDGSGAHDCHAGASAASALAASGLSWAGRWNPDFDDFFLDRVGADRNDPEQVAYWSILVDRRYAAGLCRERAASGSEVLLAYGPGQRVLVLTGPARAAIGEPVTVAVRDGWIRQTSGQDGGPVAGAAVGGATTGPDGTVTLRFDSSGLKRLKASAPDAIRSNALDVCVGDERCEGALPPPAPGPAAPAPVPGAPPPAAGRPGAPTVDVPAAGERYAAGGATRLLRGGGEGTLALGLAGLRGAACTQLRPDGTLGPRRCGSAPAQLAVPTVDGGWSLPLAGPLAPGRYTLSVASGDRATTRRFTVAAAPRGRGAAVRRAARWLRGAQAGDGGFGASLFSDWAAAGLGRAAPGGGAFRRAARRAAATRRPTLAELERGALALRGARSPRLPRLRHRIARRQRADGAWAGQVSATAYAVVALRGRRYARERRAGRAWLRRQPLPADADTLGARLWALGPGPGTRAGVAALRALQGDDGGFAASAGASANAQSTALAVLGLEHAGVRAGTVRAATGISGPDYLRARQRPDGRVEYAAGDARTPVWVTAQALLALAGPRG